MKVIDLGPKAIYRWRVEIPRSNLGSVDDFRDWLKESNITAAWVPGLAFFKTEQEAMWFLLRWS